MTIQDLIKDYNELRVGLQTLIHELDCHYSNDYEAAPGDNFASVMYKFRDRAIEKFDQLEVRYTSMDVAYKDVVSYFGEDPSDMKPDEFFGIFQTFTSSWNKAKSDIEMQKKKKEQAEKSKEFQAQRKARFNNRLDIKDGKQNQTTCSIDIALIKHYPRPNSRIRESRGQGHYGQSAGEIAVWRNGSHLVSAQESPHVCEGTETNASRVHGSEGRRSITAYTKRRGSPAAAKGCTKRVKKVHQF